MFKPIGGFFKFFAVTFFSVLIFLWVGYLQGAESPKQGMVQATLELQPEKIEPGTAVKLSATIHNAGETILPKGEVYVRYALIKPHSVQQKGVFFESEKQPLDEILPGKDVSIQFKKEHKLPSVVDFIRDDWLLHEYQLVYVHGNQENVITTLPLTFSVHYYPVFKQKTPIVPLNSL